MSTTRITWQDALLMPEDGNRYEAIDGELYVTPAPSLRHQWISRNLERALGRILEDGGHGYVFHAPVAVEFAGTEEGAQPDIVFVSRKRGHVLVPEGIRGAPDLVIEIGSPRTADRDRTVKRKLYERHGVARYWFVDPETETIDVWDFGAGADEPTRYAEQVPVYCEGEVVGTAPIAEIFQTGP